MKTIRIHNTSDIQAHGTHINRNSKAVFCITTGEVYGSVCDAAEKNEVTPGTMSHALTKHGNCRGKKFCFLGNVTEYLDEIAESLRIRESKVSAYDEIIAKQEAVRKAHEDVAIHKANYEKYCAKAEAEKKLLAEAEAEVKALGEWRN